MSWQDHGRRIVVVRPGSRAVARRSGFVHAYVQAQRQAERQRLAHQRSESKAARDAEHAQKAYERALRADAADHARLYVESRLAEVELLNDQLIATVAQLENLLHDALTMNSYLDLRTLKVTPERLAYYPGPLAVPEDAPDLQHYLPPNLGGLRKLLPGAAKEHTRRVAEAQEQYEIDVAAHATREGIRRHNLGAARAAFERQVAQSEAETAAQHAHIDALQRDLVTGDPGALVHYISLVLEASAYPSDFPQQFKMAFVPESRQLVIEYDLPTFSIVPDVRAYKYVKAQDEVTTTARPPTQRKTLYASVVAQMALRVLHEVCEADRLGHIQVLVFSGYVNAIDPGTGRPARTCVVTVRTTRDLFVGLDLSRVEPVACLKVLSASVSKSPAELAPVRPVLEFSMVDARFIEQTDVLSGLNSRPNLMDLTPNEFEALIANLFEKMGLETRLTQASRDGGVDCVAFDQRPILGGKVVIQAKRYKHTVGVSAVRDLYGTVQNEGASKGILVTTSGYGKAAFDFAQGKPLELLSGSNLLALLADHAGIEAKIEMPAQWKDPVPDAPDDGDPTA